MGAEGACRSSVLDELSQRPLSDIAREVEELRVENARLKGDLMALTSDLETLRPVSTQFPSVVLHD